MVALRGTRLSLERYYTIFDISVKGGCANRVGGQMPLALARLPPPLFSGTMTSMTFQQIETVCDEFEAALRHGETVHIEDALHKVDVSQRSTLLDELLESKIHFAVEAQRSEEYVNNMLEVLKEQFPNRQELIQSLGQQVKQLRQIGDYEILGKLGRGGMGTVYKAKHRLLQQMVAIKVLSQTLLDDTQAVGRFRREMQLIGSLVHPNIVRALNAGEIDGLHYLVMEYVNGITLQKLVYYVRTRVGGSRSPVLPLGAVCEMIRQVALGLQNAHEFKLVHRDIKPANLMLDCYGTVKLLDLGLGKFADDQRQDHRSSLTMEGMIIGTVDYISPEQCDNSGTGDVRSDLYSLGCTLFFLLTGKPVYSGPQYDTIRKKLLGHIVGEVPSLRRDIPGLPPAIDAFLQKVLSKNPADRYQTPLEFAEAITPFASFDDLWTLACEAIPPDPTEPRSGTRQSSGPYGSAPLSKYNIPPIRYKKWIVLFVVLNLLVVGLGIGAVHYFVQMRPQADHIAEQQAELRKVQWAEAEQAIEVARKLREEWKIAEAKAEYRKTIQIALKEFVETHDLIDLKFLEQARFDSAMLQWYLGNAREASNELLAIQNTIDAQLELDELSETELAPLKILVLERRADFILFGSAASGQNTERWANGIARYNEAVRVRANDPRSDVIRWKLAVLYALYGDVEEAQALLEENPLPNEADLYSALIHELAEAVLFYCQSEGNADRNEKLRTFQEQFSLQSPLPFSPLQSNPAREAIGQPEMIELVLFSVELLINDSITHEDWETLAKDVATATYVANSFMQWYPGSIPFLRRFDEVLIHSAVLLYEKLERLADKREQISNIVRLLDQMQPLAQEADAEGVQKPTLVYFFLPSTATEQGIVVFYPQDGRPGSLYRVPLTRQMVKQRSEPATVLPESLRRQIASERRIRVSWTDTAAWSRPEDALSEGEYPYENVLPLR